MAKLKTGRKPAKLNTAKESAASPSESKPVGQAISASLADDGNSGSGYIDHPDDENVYRTPNQERFYLHFDAINKHLAKGWAYSLENPTSRVRVEIWAGDTFLAFGVANVFRSDLADAKIADGCCAFEILLPVNLEQGEVYPLSARIGGTDFFLPGGPIEYSVSQAVDSSASDESIGSEVMVVPAISPGMAFDGRFDGIIDGAAEGWAHWIEEAGGPARVELWAQGTLYSVGLANIYRKDLADAGIKQGKCAFKLSLPLDLVPGQEYCFTVKIMGVSADLAGSPIVYFAKEKRSALIEQRDLFKLPIIENDKKPYFYFNKNYYIYQCMELGLSPNLGDDDFYLKHYLERGARLGLSPNPFFDEDYYLRTYPDVAREIQLGRWLSGFDHFLKIGAAENYSPVWFFDGGFYRDFYAELTDESMATGGFPDRYSHYLLVGIAERRSAHWAVHALRAIKDEPDFPIDRADLSAHVSDGVRTLFFYTIILYSPFR
jgi:hypothetical protein